jgi:hypothetical protein
MMPPVRFAMLTAAKVLLRLDVAEHGGPNRGEIVSKLLKLQGGHDGLPWCAAFYAFCYEFGHDMAGEPRAYDPGLSTKQIVQLGGVKGKVTAYPRGGDAVCFKVAPGEHDSYGTGYKHTAMFVDYDDKVAGTYWTIEGNVGDRVQMRHHGGAEPVTFVSCE